MVRARLYPSGHESFVDRTRRCLAVEAIIIARQQNIDHHADGIAWGIEFTGDLPVLAEGAVHEVLKEIAHGILAERLIGEINDREVFDHTP